MHHDEPLLAWQWRGYPDAHRDRRNLLLHVVTWPVFVSGVVMVLGALGAGSVSGSARTALGGLVAMGVAMALQGRGHALEVSPPAPFRGPLDVVLRIFGEQLVTFPRFLFSGGFARAWREAGART